MLTFFLLTKTWHRLFHVFEDDQSQLIEGWLRLTPDRRKFSETVQPTLIKIICPSVHDSVQEILDEAQANRKKVVFTKLFDYLIRTATQGAFEEVVTLYEKALKQYEVIRSKLENGKYQAIMVINRQVDC